MGTFDARQPGTPSPANDSQWVNGVSRSAAYFADQIAAGSSKAGNADLASSSGLVRVKNMTGDDLLRGNYVQLGDYRLDDVNHYHQWYEGNLYDVAEAGRIAILAAAVKEDDQASARIMGRCTARVDVLDTGHRFAAPDDGAFLLVSASSGPVEILSTNKITGTGEQELAVLIIGTQSGITKRFAICTTQADAASGTTAGPVTPGVGEATLFDFGAALGDDATAASTVSFENYAPAPVVVNKGIFLFERSTGIWVVDAEFCAAFAEA